jgi:AbiV family abortive infection protein
MKNNKKTGIDEILKSLTMTNFVFVVDDIDNYQKTGKKAKKLNLLKDPKEEKKVLGIIKNCEKNITDLQEEAKILFDKSKFARSFFLTIAAIEELGKYQIAADYYEELITQAEFKEWFKKHENKTSYLARQMIIDKNHRTKTIYNPKMGKEIEQLRQLALYAGEELPNNIITKKHAQSVIKILEKRLDEIKSAELFNQRLGSKALFK